MPPPNGQPPHDARRWEVGVNDRSERRRFGFTLSPTFASFRLSLIGRRARPIRGGGVLGEFDVQLWRSLWLRAALSHTVHSLFDEFAVDEDDEIVQTAARGKLQTTGGAIGLVYALDLGRVRPTIEAGVGGLLMQTPQAVQDGQNGGACLDEGLCEVGLRCGSDNTCSAAPLGVLHGGTAIDVLLGHHWSAGAGLRYYAPTSAPGVFPVYLTVTARLGVRW